MFVGIVGKANVGKSTFFKALTLADVEIANYPFATIKPNQGIGFVRVDCVDKEFNTQCHPREGFCVNHIRYVPVDVIDVAGLVPGACEGKGMGNQFLDDLRQADVLIHVIDCSGGTNERGEPVGHGNYDPANDLKFLEHEMDMWYYGILKRGWIKFARQVQQESRDIEPALAKQLSGLKVDEDMVKKALKKHQISKEKPAEWTDDTMMVLAKEFRQMTKPIIVAANKIDVGTAQDNLERLKQDFPDHFIIGCSAESELALKEAAKNHLITYYPGEVDFTIPEDSPLTEQQKAGLEFIRKNILQKFDSTGVQAVIEKAVFELLGYKAIFPGGVNKLGDSEGNILPDCFLMPPDSTAVDFAYKLHTDFGKNFIKAIDVKKKLPVSKEHILNHRDVIEIMSR